MPEKRNSSSKNSLAWSIPLCLLLIQTALSFRLLASRKPDIYTSPKNVPGYIHQMIHKYRKSENNIFFILSPVNSNHFHGDILHSSVNASAGGKNNTQVNVKTLNEKIEAKEFEMVISNLEKLEATVTKLEGVHARKNRLYLRRHLRNNTLVRKRYMDRKALRLKNRLGATKR